jgi:hypothetical protein
MNQNPFYLVWRCAFHPRISFRELAAAEPRLGNSLLRMLLLRTPLAFAESLLAWWSFSSLYLGLANPDGSFWRELSARLPPEVGPKDLQAMLRILPALPPMARVLPWLLLLAPVLVLSLWLHDAVWDHGCLWILKGLKAKRSFRISLLADADALSAGSLGALIGLLVYLPGLGSYFVMPCGLVAFYFWVLRGFALSAFHDCPTWKGVLATLLHAVFMGCCAVGFLALFLLLLSQILA